MPRPVKRRRVCCLPSCSRFGPLECGSSEMDCIQMTIDEYETIRLIDIEALTQEQCAEQMSVARTTVQGIYLEARKKIATALVESKMLVIEGGQYRLCEEKTVSCGRNHKTAKRCKM